MNNKIKIVLFSLILLGFSSTSALASLESDFNARKNQMIADDGLAWAWLENCQSNFGYYNDLIWQHLEEIWKYYSTRSRRQGLVHLVRARYQYPHCLTQNQINNIDNYLHDYYEGALYGTEGFWTGAASANQQISVLVSMYVYGEDNPNATCFYEENPNTNIWKDFTYQGRSYSKGNTYNLLEFSGDYLQWLFDRYVDKNKYTNYWQYAGEMDSRTYSISQMKGILLVRDLAQDQTITKKADMVFTLVVLNAKMDFSARHWGSSLASRTYANSIFDNSSLDFSWGIFGDWTNYKYLWADPRQYPESDPKWDYAVRYDSRSVSMVTPRPYDSLLLELGNVDKEDNSYSHIHIEKNASKAKWIHVGDELDSANWNYLTKYYNLGGNRNEWTLQVRSHNKDPWGGEKSWAFRFWTNNDYIGEDDNEPAHYMGHRNIQYKNAIFILDSEERQVMAPEWYIDSQQNTGGWTFYRINTGEEVNNGQDVEIVVAFKNDNRALEVCTVGVDYSSYQDFKSAILSNASVTGTSFTTSKGDVISTDGQYNYGLVNGKPIWEEYGHPIPDFPLMTTYDKDGNKMISWDWSTKKLTLSRGGQTKVYDYANWTSDSDITPTKTGDLNSDGKVDVIDLGIFLSNWGSTSRPTSDLNQDGQVDVVDLGIMLSNWG